MRKAVTPVDLYALQDNKQTDKDVNPQTGLPANQQIGKNASKQSGKEVNKQVDKKDSKLAGKEAKKQTSLEENLQTGKQVVKYSTYLSEDLIKKIKYKALDTDRKDYEVLEDIVEGYFKKETNAK